MILCSHPDCCQPVEMRADRTKTPIRYVYDSGNVHHPGMNYFYPSVPVGDKCWYHNRFINGKHKLTIAREAEREQFIKAQTIESI